MNGTVSVARVAPVKGAAPAAGQGIPMDAANPGAGSTPAAEVFP